MRVAHPEQRVEEEARERKVLERSPYAMHHGERRPKRPSRKSMMKARPQGSQPLPPERPHDGLHGEAAEMTRTAPWSTRPSTAMSTARRRPVRRETGTVPQDGDRMSSSYPSVVLFMSLVSTGELHMEIRDERGIARYLWLKRTIH